MKNFFEEYGLLILTAVVVIILIAIANPTSNVIKYNVQTVVQSFRRTETAFEKKIPMPVSKRVTIEASEEEIKNTELVLKDFLANTNILEELIKAGNTNFEIDSKCPNSEMVAKIDQQITENSLLATGTWAYMGSPKVKEDRYLFWTDANVNDLGADKEIPVIVNRADGKFFVSKSVTSGRKKNGKLYYAIMAHTSITDLRSYASGTEYSNLKDTLKAYEDLKNA